MSESPHTFICLDSHRGCYFGFILWWVCLIDLLNLGICRTLTTPVDLLKCLKSIRDYAFVSSDYPVILTLEDHLTRKLQDKAKEV